MRQAATNWYQYFNSVGPYNHHALTAVDIYTRKRYEIQSLHTYTQYCPIFTHSNILTLTIIYIYHIYV